MQLNVLKDTLRDKVAHGQTPSVLAYLQTVWAKNPDQLSDTYLMAAQLTRLENQKNNGVIAHDNYNLESNRITQTVLGFINDLTENDLLKTGMPKFDRQTDNSESYEKEYETELEILISALKLPPLGKIKLVDCDRDVPYLDFKKAYRTILKSPYQFYFVTAQAAEQPANFAERVIYEIIANTLKGSDQAINYPRRVCKITAQERVDFPELPFDDFGDLSDNQSLFRTHFAERMKRFQLDATPIEDFVAGTAKRLPYRFFTFLFRIDFDTWGWMPEMTEYLAWIVQTFKANTAHEPLMSFQFVFVVSSAKTNVSENGDIRTGIENILRGCNEAEKQPAVWLKNFTPVPEIDLTSWFLKLTQDQFQPQIKRIINEATAGFAQRDLLNMADLEELFLTVYNVSQRL
jgi:Effector-associated domain 11